MSRIELIEGSRWARETCEKMPEGMPIPRVIAALELGCQGKPADYAAPIRAAIEAIQARYRGVEV